MVRLWKQVSFFQTITTIPCEAIFALSQIGRAWEDKLDWENKLEKWEDKTRQPQRNTQHLERKGSEIPTKPPLVNRGSLPSTADHLECDGPASHAKAMVVD